MPLLFLLVLLPVIIFLLMPLILFQRYRAGTARRQARPWIATLALFAILFSVVFFMVAAGVTNYWIPHALLGAAAGLSVGCVLGALGLFVTRWEITPRALHYTPNRWLVMFITVIVSARVVYGLWRSWSVAQAGVYGTAYVTAFGVPQSLAAGATVLGYYLVYNAGLRWRIRQWQAGR